MAEEITPAEREAFKKAFDEFDVNKDGHISSKELKTVLQKLGQNPSAAEIAEFVKECDKDSSGTIEFKEFSSYLVERRRRVFGEIDTDKNGYITPEELKQGFKMFGVEINADEAKKIVDAADTDHDGRISYIEFIKALQERPLALV